MTPQQRAQAILVMAQWLKSIGVTDPAQARKGATQFVDGAIAAGASGGPEPS